VIAPDEDDWGKLNFVLKYLTGMRYLKLKLNADELSFKIHLYIDGLHQIHDDCQGHVGSLDSFRKVEITISSHKKISQKINATKEAQWRQRLLSYMTN
jgi:hypothetical protein